MKLTSLITRRNQPLCSAQLIIASGLAWWAYRQNRRYLTYLLSIALVVYGLSFYYAFRRLTEPKPLSNLNVGLVSLAEPRHHKAQQATAQQLNGLLED